jgi:nucleoside-diphosphate-sugar epimerase
MSVHVVTGAFGYTGKYIAAHLLNMGETVRTLTDSLNRPNPFGDRVKAEPFHFHEHEKLVAFLSGADVCYNTYWVRFNYSGFTYPIAVENTLRLFEAVKKAGVRRIVHVSITNPSMESSLEYFSGKARLERELMHTGLINNIAWTLRHLPVFGVFGDGEYRLQPIYVEDLAELAICAGQGCDNDVIDAVGPETFTFRGLVEAIETVIGKRRPVISVPPWLGYVVACMIGNILGDVFLTRDEIKGLMSGLLCTQSKPAGSTRLTEWALRNKDVLGVHYASELARRLHRDKSYESLSR